MLDALRVVNAPVDGVVLPTGTLLSADKPIVPVVVIVPPVSGAVATIWVTVPVPGGVAQVPSPRQYVEDDAPVPPFKTPTGTLVVGTK